MEIAKWDKTKWLVGSSFTFLIPSFYAFRKKHHCYSLILFGTTLCSVNHWRKAENGVRRMIDIAYASFSFTTFLTTGIRVMRNFKGYSGLGAIIYCYKMSNHLYHTEGPDSNWYIYHFIFHLLMTLLLMCIIKRS